MLLRRSRYVHQLPLGSGRILIVHAVSHMRLPADREVGVLLDHFAMPRNVPEDCAAMTKLVPYSQEQIERAIAGLIERQVLTNKTPEEEEAAIASELEPTHGRDPVKLLEKYRRSLKEGAENYWAAQKAKSIGRLSATGTRIDAVLFGDCDVQVEAEFLQQEAVKRGNNLRVAATFPDDVRFVEEHKHDIVFIGALRSRHLIAGDSAESPHAAYIAEAHHLLTQLRAKTVAPILIDNLPEPTVQPMGLAEQGLAGHRTRFRRANVMLAETAASVKDVYIVDIAAALAAHGSEAMLDDGLVGFTHFGSPGWLLQRPEREKAAVHNIFPDLAPLAQTVGGNPYNREAITSIAHIDALMTVLGIGRKKCVIVDLDGTLWPGVLAETKAPFAWTPEISGGFSYIGLYFGLHEALISLKKRGIVLACVSKNDEATVRELWRYPDNYPKAKLLTPDDFVTWRVNWNDKVENIKSIADELGFALDSFIFIDDHPVERDRVRQRLPDVEVWGENIFALRRQLLNDPRLQVPSVTASAAARTESTKAQLSRQHLRAEAIDEKTYLASLNITCRIERENVGSERFERVSELFQRTTQFNSTGRQFSRGELESLTAGKGSAVFTIDVSDRFGDHGLVGAAVIADDEIVGLAVSCRALGMGIEHTFMQHILAEWKKTGAPLKARIMETARNIPVRNIYRDNGFSVQDEGVWFWKP